MVIEGDFALTISDTTLSCNSSSVDLEGDSSSVHLDDYIEWSPLRVVPQGSLGVRHTVTLVIMTLH